MRVRLFTVALALALTGCGQPDGSGAEPPAGEEETATATPAPPDEPASRLEGTLGGDAQLEGGCVWLDTDRGRYEVLWPEGYRAEADPVRLVGPDGDTVAGAGDRLRVEGAVEEGAMSVCQVGPIFAATSVEAA